MSSTSPSLSCSSTQVNGFGLRPQRSLLYQPTSFSFSRKRTHGIVKASARIDRFSKSDIIVSPSILSANFSKLGEQVKAVELAGCDWIHVDVMDGRFVPNITIGPLVVDALRPVTDLPLDVHLMIVEPEQRVPDFIKAGADIVSVHCEQSSTIHLHRTVNQIKSLGAKAGVVLNPGTPLTAIEYVLDGEFSCPNTALALASNDKVVFIVVSFVSGISGGSGLDNVGQPWVWWAKLYRKPSKENLGLEKNVCRKGIDPVTSL